MFKKWVIARQYWATITASFATMSAASIFGWTSPVVARLEEPNAYIQISPSQGSWIGSLTAVGGIVGSFLGGYLADKIGRKRTLLSMALPLQLNWILITAAQNVDMILTGRFIGGLAIGGIGVVAPSMYIAEIAEDKIRGSLVSFYPAFLCAGYLYSYAIGPYVSYVWLGIAEMLLPIVFVVTFFFMPETPYYYLMKGKKDEASKSLQWLRNSTEVEAELTAMEDSVREAVENCGRLRDLFATRAAVKALYLSAGLRVFEQLTGVSVLIFYTTSVFKMANGSLDDDIATIIVGAVQVLAAFQVPFFVERLGRRQLLLISASVMGTAQFALGTYFYLKDVARTDMSSVGWLPITSLVIFVVSYNLGYGSTTSVVFSEMFQTNVNSIGSSTTSCFSAIFVFITTKYYQNLVDGLGAYFTFYIFSGCCFLSNLFVFFLLPETKGKSLQEIQEILSK